MVVRICLLLAGWFVVQYAAMAAEVQELEQEVVIGKRERDIPRLGYQTPEVFDPFTDILWQGGYRDYPPSEIPEGLKYATAMARTTKLGRIAVCADAFYWPFSHTMKTSEPPGIDIEIVRRIAKRHDWRIEMMWAPNTISRGGVGAAFKKGIDRGYCDVFLGLVITGDDHHMDGHQMVFTKPYIGMGFVLVTQGKAKGLKSLEEVVKANIKIGVPAFSPMYDYVKDKGIPYESYALNFRLVDAFVKGEVDAAMVWEPGLPVAKKEKGYDIKPVPGYIPVAGQRWNGAWGVKGKESEFITFLDDELTKMVANGELKQIVESYGLNYYPPFAN
jgi:ABC-type amino acid transport substrate-binding protein